MKARTSILTLLLNNSSFGAADRVDALIYVGFIKQQLPTTAIKSVYLLLKTVFIVF